MEPSVKNHSLIVVNWNLGLLRVCARKGMYYVPADYTRNLDCLMLFKKTCNNTIKFASKNIPYALIQVCLSTRDCRQHVVNKFCLFNSVFKTKAVTIAVYAYGLASLMARMPSKLAPDGTWESTAVSFISGYFPVANFIPVCKLTLNYPWRIGNTIAVFALRCAL